MLQSGKGNGLAPPAPSKGKCNGIAVDPNSEHEKRCAEGKGCAPPPPNKGKCKGITDDPSSEEEKRRTEICQLLKNVPFFDSSSDARALHGRAYTNCLPVHAPRVTWASDKKPREHSEAWLTATEYEDEPDVLKAKVVLLATLLRISHKTVAYSGAGLSVAAGVRMAAIGSKSATKLATGDPLPHGAHEDTEVVEKIDSLDEEPKSEELVAEVLQGDSGKGQIGYVGKGTSKGKKGGPPPAPKPAGKGKLPPKPAPDLTTEALPTSLHYAMAELNHRDLLHGWVQQNHDCLPQKAGYLQENITEIHGSWYDPSNQVVKYSGTLRDDVYKEMDELSNTADLCLVMGTSLTGLTSDMVATKPAIRSTYAKALGIVIISPQRTSVDGKASLRIFSKAEFVIQLLMGELGLSPLCAIPADIFPQDLKVVVPYDRHGIRSATVQIVWDLSPTQKVHLGTHQNSELARQPDYLHLTWNDEAKVLPLDRQNFCIPLSFPPAPGPRGQLAGNVILKLGVWWLNAARRGGVARLPVVNVGAEEFGV